MKKFMGFILTLSCIMQLSIMQVFAAGCDITSYAFANIAGSIKGTTINVTVPYRTTATYWDHKVDTSPGATFRTSSITQLDDKHYQGTITVVGDDGTSKEYTVNINKADFMEPTYSISKAKTIKKNGAKIPVEVNYNDAKVTYVRLYYYQSKSSTYKTYANVPDEGESTIELSNLKSGTKYYYYLEVVTSDKTYTTSSKSFTTKEEKDQGTSSSTSTSNTSSSSSSSSSTSKGTNSSGPGTDAKQDTTVRNEWKLVDGKWYYFGADGFSKVGWFEVGGKWYYVTKGTNELAMSGWKKISNVWYMFDASGAMIANNWVFSGDKWYWMGSSGSMLVSQEIDVAGKHYLLNPDGTCADNVWVMKDGKWQYYKAGAAGLARNENFTYNGVTYYADANGFVN